MKYLEDKLRKENRQNLNKRVKAMEGLHSDIISQITKQKKRGQETPEH